MREIQNIIFIPLNLMFFIAWKMLGNLFKIWKEEEEEDNKILKFIYMLKFSHMNHWNECVRGWGGGGILYNLTYITVWEFAKSGRIQKKQKVGRRKKEGRC